MWCYQSADLILKYVRKLNLPIKKFDNFYEVYERFFKKYNGKEELFLIDAPKMNHLNNNANIELVKNFLLPEIYELTK